MPEPELLRPRAAARLPPSIVARNAVGPAKGPQDRLHRNSLSSLKQGPGVGLGWLGPRRPGGKDGWTRMRWARSGPPMRLVNDDEAVGADRQDRGEWIAQDQQRQEHQCPFHKPLDGRPGRMLRKSEQFFPQLQFDRQPPNWVL